MDAYTLMDRRTDAEVEYGARLEGHYGGTEWTFDRVHTFPREVPTGLVGGMICVRGATGRRTTTTVESFPHLYWTKEAPTSMPCTVCGSPLSIGEGPTCADTGAPCREDDTLYAVVDEYDHGFIRWSYIDEGHGVDELLETRVTFKESEAYRLARPLSSVLDVTMDLVAVLQWRESIATDAVPHYFGSGETTIETVESRPADGLFYVTLSNGEQYEVRVQRAQ